MSAVNILSLLTCILGCIIAACLGRFFRKQDPMRIAKAIIFTCLLSWLVLVGGGGHGIAVVRLPSIAVIALACYSIHSEDYINASPEFVSQEINEIQILLAISVISWLLVFFSYWFFSQPIKIKARQP
jgi:hypothetical protein